MILEKAHCPSRPPISCYCGELMRVLLASRPWEKGSAGGRWQRTFLRFRKSVHPGVPFSPDVQTAEDGKENSCSEGHGDSQEKCQELVDHVFADFKEGMAANPHFVKGVCSHRLCNHILEAHLQDTGTPYCHPTHSPRNQECWDRRSDKEGAGWVAYLLLG